MVKKAARSKSKLIVASTRLPVTMSRGSTKWEVTSSTGGLVTALKAVKERRKFTWLGWPGAYIPPTEQPAAVRELAKHGCCPVFITESDMVGFYEKFSNGSLWPLFHNLTDRTHFDRGAWRSYQQVNRMYADAIAKLAAPGDFIWVHDYQLCLLPELLRDRGLGCPIGFFLHIPFPSSETYRTLPVNEEVLRGLLGADLIGFHSYEYVSHFRLACLRVLGLESEPDRVGLQSRGVKLSVLPIGIDPGEIRTMVRSAAAREEFTELSRTFAGKKIICGVDRLDYTKGIPQKLEAFEELLEERPDWRENCVLIQVAAPTRTGVEEYQQLKRDVDERVGRINGRYGSSSHTPVVYVNQSVERDRLCGLYRAADVALVTPIRDGMNLVALEYVAARGERGGNLILSEFTGAAHCLAGARLVNPYNSSRLAGVIAEALDSDSPHSESFGHMLNFVNENTSMRWANHFLDRLEEFSGDPTHEAALFRVREHRMKARVEKARRPLVFLDYDGTLRSYVINPREAVPDARILNVLEELAQHATVYVVSGRDGNTLESWLGQLPIGLVAEHGLSMRAPGEKWHQRANISGSALTRLVRPLFEDFTRRTPGSAIEYKKAAIAWHYRAADPEYSVFQAMELLTRLEDLLKRRPYKVLRGSRVIEVRHEHVTKGNAVAHLLDRHPDADFLFCAGDDRTDEDMMRAIPDSWQARAVTCWVGSVNPWAAYWRESNTALLSELEQMVKIWHRTKPEVHTVRSGSANSATAESRARAPKAKKAPPHRRTKRAAPKKRRAPARKRAKAQSR